MESISWGIIKLLRWSFFSKYTTFYVVFKKAIKIKGNVFGFEDNIVGICCRNFSQSWPEYMWYAVNVLKRCAKISSLTKTDVFQLNLSAINAGQCRCRAGLNSIWDALLCWMRKTFWKKSFQAFKWPHFLGSITSGIIKLWSWFFFYCIFEI